ncbi:MAG: hypothetical protein MZV63_50620 [Marinilabiliales bacterium]|nr:hypothetical protein [Marinilabiliales bacterium]
MLNLNFNKGDGLIPAVIQDNTTMQVLMVGYMNEEAYLKTAERRQGNLLQPQQTEAMDQGRDLRQLPHA